MNVLRLIESRYTIYLNDCYWNLYNSAVPVLKDNLSFKLIHSFQATSSVRTHSPQYYSNSLPAHAEVAQERKFAEKPNALKKVALDDIDEIQTNSISDGGFSWSNMLGMCVNQTTNKKR